MRRRRSLKREKKWEKKKGKKKQASDDVKNRCKRREKGQKFIVEKGRGVGRREEKRVR